MSETPQPQPEKRHAELIDLIALADEFEKKGNHQQAAKYRALAKTQIEIERAKSEQAENFSLHQYVAEGNKEIEQEIEARRHIPPSIQDPSMKPVNIAEITQKGAAQTRQNLPPTAPRIPPPPRGK